MKFIPEIPFLEELDPTHLMESDETFEESEKFEWPVYDEALGG